MVSRISGAHFVEEEVTSRHRPENALNPASSYLHADLAKAQKRIIEMEKMLADYESALHSAEQSAIDYEEEAKTANAEWDAAIAQSAAMSTRLKDLEAAKKELADAVNTKGYTLVERVENVYPRFTEITYESISFGASLALNDVRVSSGHDFHHLDVIEDDIVEEMIADFEVMELAGKSIRDASNPHFPIAKACGK